jgi:hypothetical protein
MTHDIKDFVGFFDNCAGHPARKNWRFIFVIPAQTHVAMKCLGLLLPATDTLRALALYSAEVTME